MDQYLDEITYKFQKKIVKAWLLRGPPRGRPPEERDPSPGRRGRRAAPRPRLRPVHPRPDPGAVRCDPEHPLRLPEAGYHLGARKRSAICTTTTSPPTPWARPAAPASANRREKGHGALAERALDPVIPSVEDFPYAIRVVSEVVSSNGSTSQGSICGSTLALMDAGVPIKAPVAGISCGLIQDDDGSFTTFIDIQGVEDFHGEMDFKVAGTKDGITAIQMDLKNDGLSHEIIKEALAITGDARKAILDEIMLPCISAPRAEVSQVCAQDDHHEDRPR